MHSTMVYINRVAIDAPSNSLMISTMRTIGYSGGGGGVVEGYTFLTWSAFFLLWMNRKFSISFQGQNIFIVFLSFRARIFFLKV